MRNSNKTLGTAFVALALMAGLSAPAVAQDTDIDFGDDASEWANDGECDDMRFAGEGMAAGLEDADVGHDATDCRTLFEDGKISLASPDEDDAEASEAEQAPAETIETPAAETPVTEPEATEAPGVTVEEIDFGDDSSEWANDGECDDMRFAGEGMAEEFDSADVARDATDCRTLFEEGKISLAPPDEGDGQATAPTRTPAADIDFGDDSAEWANDQECDDPRFAGDGMAPPDSLEDANIGRDATDCRNAYDDGSIALVGEEVPGGSNDSAWLAALANRIDFGNDSGSWPNDGECDDPDFVGSGAVSDPSDTERLKDATDCRAAFIAGTVTLNTSGSMPVFDYGGDYSEWANDGRCDDWRFTGPGMAGKLSYVDVQGDATDCQALEAEGQVSIKPIYQPDYALKGPYDSSDVDFGDNSSYYANDAACDDPRFEGPGATSALSETRTDADDCRDAFEQGTVALREGED